MSEDPENERAPGGAGSSDPSSTGGAAQAEGGSAWTTARPAGFALEFESWLDPALYAELAGLMRRRAAVDRAAALPGLLIGVGAGLLGVVAAIWAETASRWVAIEETGLAALLFDPNGRPFIPLVLFSLGFLALGFVGRWLEQTLSARRQIRLRLRQELLREKALVRLDASGVALIGDGHQSAYDWRLIEEVRAETGAIWLLVGAGAVPVPRAAVGGPVEVEALLGRIEAFREAAAAETA